MVKEHSVRVRVPIELWDAFASTAREGGRTASGLIRLMMKDFVEKDRLEKEARRKAPEFVEEGENHDELDGA